MLTHEQIVIRLVLAAVLGGFVGLERERLDWAAGLRTHMLVCLGASLFMIVSSFGFMDIINHEHVSLDPSRVAAQVVSGIGFLGAGTIMFRRDVILGLTTAASLWAVAAVGLAVGGGLYTPALITTLLIVVILAWIKPFEKRLFQNRRPRSVKLVVALRC
jgi:putative Mg2+ transporter-C (MgtC) family protein